MKSGQDLYDLAATRKGERYVNVLVPKDNANWHGPWDCAEFASWTVYQTIGKLYGCVDNNSDPATTEAYSGAWARDARSGVLTATNQHAANTEAGVILIRKPPMAGRMGHIAISDGRGGTMEAAGQALGVRAGRVEGRVWHFFAKIPELAYSSTGAVVTPKPLPFLLTLESPNIKSPRVKAVQQALKAKGFDPGIIDSEYGPHTVAAVAAFQSTNRLVSDGIVGPLTAAKLGIAWP